jgi:hypothetical protein
LKSGHVLRRTVFYIAGFDPRGPVHYHRLYAEESAKQAAVNDLAITVSRRRTVDEIEAAWQLEADGTVTQYRFLRYEDIVRRQWPRNGLAMFGAVFRYSRHFLGMGVFAMIMRNSWPGFVAVAYPPVLVAGLFLLAAVLGVLIAVALSSYIGGWAWLAVPAALTLPFLGYRQIEKHLNAFWLARSCSFLVDRSLGRVPGIEERCIAFAERVANAVNRGDTDEVCWSDIVSVRIWR